MYHVTVRYGRKVVARKSFRFGEWQEIIFWLGETGLSESEYRVTIEFEEKED